MTPDWIEDENLTREEKLARFEELEPEPAHGPPLYRYTYVHTAGVSAGRAYEPIVRSNGAVAAPEPAA